MKYFLKYFDFSPASADDSDLIAKSKVDLLWRMIFELRAGVSS